MEDPRYPIGRFSLDKEVTQEKRQRWIRDIGHAPELLRKATTGLTPGSTRYTLPRRRLDSSAGCSSSRRQPYELFHQNQACPYGRDAYHQTLRSERLGDECRCARHGHRCLVVAARRAARTVRGTAFFLAPRGLRTHFQPSGEWLSNSGQAVADLRMARKASYSAYNFASRQKRLVAYSSSPSDCM